MIPYKFRPGPRTPGGRLHRNGPGMSGSASRHRRRCDIGNTRLFPMESARRPACLKRPLKTFNFSISNRKTEPRPQGSATTSATRIHVRGSAPLRSRLGCRLPMVGYRWSVTDGRLPMVGYRWSVTDGRLPMVGYRWSVTDGRLSMVAYQLFVLPIGSNRIGSLSWCYVHSFPGSGTARHL